MTVFWTNPVVFRATVFTLFVAALQRPLTSMMPAINDRFSLFSPAYFTLLTASLTAGGLLAGLVHARRNSDLGQERANMNVMVAFVFLQGCLFPMMSLFQGATALALVFLFLLGFGGSYVVTGNSIILQNRTPEHMRSRVLGNNLMMSRATGAVSVLIVGLLADAQGFAVAMTSAALLVGIVLPLVLARGIRSIA